MEAEAEVEVVVKIVTEETEEVQQPHYLQLPLDLQALAKVPQCIRMCI